jgi:DegV family protein with EDD domain
MFTKVYGDLVRSGAEEIISIHLSSNLSNIYNVACLAAEELNGVKISVVDGGQLTMGTGMLVLEAVKAASEGKHAAEITSMLREMTKKIFTFAVIDTFEYLKRSGRVSHLVGGIGEILQVKPILKMNNGNVSLEKIRTRKNAIRRLIKLITDLGPLSSLSVVHTNYLKGAEELIGELKKTFPNISPAFISQVTPIIGVHIGPGAVGFVAVQE